SAVPVLSAPAPNDRCSPPPPRDRRKPEQPGGIADAQRGGCRRCRWPRRSCARSAEPRPFPPPTGGAERFVPAQSPLRPPQLALQLRLRNRGSTLLLNHQATGDVGDLRRL